MRHRREPRRQTAQKFLSRGQAVILVALLVIALGGLIRDTHQTLIAFVAFSLTFYLCFVGLKLALWYGAIRYRPPSGQPIAAEDESLPVVTVLVPLFHEANMVKTLVAAINRLNYPKEKLQVLLLLEIDDEETRLEADWVTAELPWYETVLIPNVPPRGKPKALNMGLAQARGAFCVIYDAEDRPDPDQLLKAVGAFRAGPERLACVQARLFFWNESSSWVTRFYFAEYVTHFEWVLAGLAKFGLIPPLGGTSNIFKTEVLRAIAIPHELLPPGAEGIGGWDPWNVTEDAELAGALALHGYTVAMIDSVTLEEATATLKIADGQRRRWLKGYLQTGLVYTRKPFRTARRMGFRRWFAYILLMLGTPISLILNVIFWGVTIIYFATRTTVIERLFPLPLYYTGILLMVAGNMVLFYQLVIACMKRGNYGSVRYMLLTPVWWIFTSYSCYRMMFELILPSTRQKWNKTAHGHDLLREAEFEAQIQTDLAPDQTQI